MLCRAKINLTLHVGAPFSSGRWIGYHPVESLVVFADIGDEIQIETGADRHELSIEGPFAKGLSGEEDNLILRALKACKAPPSRVELIKNLPVSAGLGGGSANAAAIVRQFGRDCVSAVDLGADVPVCTLSRTAMMEGIGERITSVSGLGRFPAVLVNPGQPVSTGAIFKAYDLTDPPEVPERTDQEGGFLSRALSGRNDLEDIAVEIEPSIGEVLDELATLEGCRLARMSGSGATCFGLFDTMEQADKAAKALARLNWWSVSTWLGDEV